MAEAPTLLSFRIVDGVIQPEELSNYPDDVDEVVVTDRSGVAFTAIAEWAEGSEPGHFPVFFIVGSEKGYRTLHYDGAKFTQVFHFVSQNVRGEGKVGVRLWIGEDYVVDRTVAFRRVQP